MCNECGQMMFVYHTEKPCVYEIKSSSKLPETDTDQANVFDMSKASTLNRDTQYDCETTYESLNVFFYLLYCLGDDNMGDR